MKQAMLNKIDGMNEELDHIENNESWELTQIPTEKNIMSHKVGFQKYNE